MQTNPMNLKNIVVAAVLVAGNAFALTSSGNAPQSQASITPCRISIDAPPIGFWTWPANAKVKVYVLQSDFTSSQTAHLVSALKSWNDVSDLTGSGVKFDYVGATAESLTCENCVTIMRGEVFDSRRRHVTELRAHSLHHNQLITYAEIVVDPVLTNPKALSEALAHELGHNLGLLDCYQCKRQSTVMGKFEKINTPNNLAQPTPCDIAQVRRAYEELRVRVRPSPNFSSAEDEGEEPVDDDTPIVVPKP